MDTKALKSGTKPAEALKVPATNSEREFPVDEVKKALIRELEIEALEGMLNNKRRNQWHLIRILQEIKQD